MSESMNQPNPKKAIFFRYIGIGFLLAGGILFFVAIRYFVVRSFGLALGILGSYLLRLSRTGTQNALYGANNEVDLLVKKRPGYLAWSAAAASLLAVVVCYWFLHEDAIGGGYQVWPVYAFAGSVVVFAVISSYLAAKLFLMR